MIHFDQARKVRSLVCSLWYIIQSIHEHPKKPTSSSLTAYKTKFRHSLLLEILSLTASKSNGILGVARMPIYRDHRQIPHDGNVNSPLPKPLVPCRFLSWNTSWKKLLSRRELQNNPKPSPLTYISTSSRFDDDRQDASSRPFHPSPIDHGPTGWDVLSKSFVGVNQDGANVDRVTVPK